jgi:hypothetical protein
MLREFREFIARGHALDMAVGILLGVAFGAVVSSLVADIIMVSHRPPGEPDAPSGGAARGGEGVPVLLLDDRPGATRCPHCTSSLAAAEGAR